MSLARVAGIVALSWLAMPVAGYAQPAKLSRIGLLVPAPHPSAWTDAFRQELRNLGYVASSKTSGSGHGDASGDQGPG